MVVRTGRAPRMSPDERRAAVVRAALPLVLEHGPAVTTRQIAEAAGVAEGTIFRVFADKEALVDAVVARAFDPSDALAELAAVDRSLDLRSRLVTAVQITQRRLSGVITLLDRLGPTTPHRDRRQARPMEAVFRSAIAELVAADRDQLRVAPDEFAQLLRMLTFSATHPRISEGCPLPATHIVDVLLHGLLAHPCTTAREGHRSC